MRRGQGCRGFGLLWPVLDLDGKLPDELPEEVGVAVLAELVEHKPVADLKAETTFNTQGVKLSL